MLRFVGRVVRRTAVLGIGAGAVVVGFNEAERRFWESRPNNGYAQHAKSRPKIVVVGSGWAAAYFLLSIDTNKFDVVCVSPRNYFLFTPLLPSTTVGTLENRSIVVPMRELVARHPLSHRIASLIAGYRFPDAQFIEATCESIDPKTKSISCAFPKGTRNSNECPNITLNYDHLVIAVGAEPFTFNTPGVRENCFFLKSVEDSVAIRGRMMECLEAAAASSSEADKMRHLSFVVVGGGPTGVEFAAEANDFLQQDVPRLYPNEAKYASVTLLQSSDHILSTYDLQISEFTESLFSRSNIRVVTNSRVLGVTPTHLQLKDKTLHELQYLPYSLCVWSTGVKPVKMVRDFMLTIPEQMENRRALATDAFLRVIGVDSVYALGDCCTVKHCNIIQAAEELFNQADTNHDGLLCKTELYALLPTVAKRFPETFVFLSHAVRHLHKYGTKHPNALTKEEFFTVLREVGQKLKSYPATAQVAAQQGTYLARFFNNYTDSPFTYTHKGELAYVGKDNAAACLGGDLDGGGVVLTGAAAGLLWHAAYLDMLWVFGLKSTLLVSFDWMKAAVFGRDSSRV